MKSLKCTSMQTVVSRRKKCTKQSINFYAIHIQCPWPMYIFILCNVFCVCVCCCCSLLYVIVAKLNNTEVSMIKRRQKKMRCQTQKYIPKHIAHIWIYRQHKIYRFSFGIFILVYGMGKLLKFLSPNSAFSMFFSVRPPKKRRTRYESEQRAFLTFFLFEILQLLYLNVEQIDTRNMELNHGLHVIKYAQFHA